MKLFTHDVNGTTFYIKVGRNKQDNWAIIDDAEPHDLWFHLDGKLPSAHVIVSYVGKWKEMGYPHEILKLAANYCRQFSKASHILSNTKHVCYTEVENIKKGREIGSVIICDDNRLNVLI